MSRIRSYTPPWLTKSAPGHDLFATTSEELKISAFSPYGSNKKKSRPGPRRTIARRGTEVFVAVNREIRWGDLVYLKEKWEEKAPSARSRVKREQSVDSSFDIYDEEQNGPDSTQESTFTTAEGLRIIKTPVADEIRQLILSPNSSFLAVLTTHTVHICCLPESSHLTAADTSPLKPRFYTLGPTTHVTSRSAVMSAVWHPLGVNGFSLVTITEDAQVRVWEISTTDRMSFDQPTIAIDLRKLADGTSLDQNFTTSIDVTSKGFSPDSFDMEVAAASFAVKGSGLWSSMTLFVAMRGGDVYALCPLLPQRWAPPPTLIPSLSVSIVAKLAVIEDDPDVSAQDKLLVQQQIEWIEDLDNQEPRIMEGSLGEPPVEVFQRPRHPGPVPKLQGPLILDVALDAEDDLDAELADIYVIGRKMEIDDLMMGEDQDLELNENEQEGLSLSVICLLSTSGQLRICLDLDGIEAKWLPPRQQSKISSFAVESGPPSLLVFQTMDTMQPHEVSSEDWPVFSEDAISRYAFFVTYASGISQVSLSPWVFRLESELNALSESQSNLRIDLVARSNSDRDRIYQQGPPGISLAACVAIRDPDLGYFILSATPSEPVAVVLEAPRDDTLTLRPASPSPYYEHYSRSPETKPLDMYIPRPLFQPSGVFDEPSQLPALLQMLKTSRYGTLTQQEVRLSPLTLKIFSNVHATLSVETGRLNTAVSELFRRCDSLRADLSEQITKANELKTRIDRITGDEEGVRDSGTDEARITKALHARVERQKQLNDRFEKLRKKLSKITTRELTDKEKQWVAEVRGLKSGVLGSDGENGQDNHDDVKKTASSMTQAWKRFEKIKELKEDLVSQAEEIQRKSGAEAASDAGSVSSLKIPQEIRRAKVSQVMSLLERETALVDAVKGRLEKLSIG